MKRFISGSSNLFRRESSGSAPSTPKQRSASSFAKRLVSGDSTPNIPDMIPNEEQTLSPELIPIVTLISAHTHRRYHRGTMLILKDLKSDGTPTGNAWEEVYAVLVGTQLAIWDAHELADCKDDVKEINNRLKKLASKPTYLNLTDSSVRAVGTNDNFTTEGGQPFENALVISTTLKNRYFLKFNNLQSYNEWYAAIRLSQYESVALQLAYTGAFLSSRGRKLGDIQVILADNKFNHSEWESVRFGTGMPWKRCYAVITQSGNKKKSNVGSISFYENDKKVKKTGIMATVNDANEIFAVYPSSPKLIDTSTIIKLQGTITFTEKDKEEQTNIFIMPEKHQGVPGYDTIIRFLIPTMNAFRLYGRPERLIAGRDDPASLVYALPTLPNVHYLDCKDVMSIIDSIDQATLTTWTDEDWRHEINDILLGKIRDGYTGISSDRKDNSVLTSPVISPEELFRGTNTIGDTPFARIVSRDASKSGSTSIFNSSKQNDIGQNDPFQQQPSPDNSSIKHSDFDFSVSATNEPESGLHDLREATPEDRLMVGKDVNMARKSEAGLGAIYDKYAVLPATRTSKEVSPSTNILETTGIRKTESPYEKYLGSATENKMFEISNIRDSNSSVTTEEDGRDSSNAFQDARASDHNSFNDLGEKIGAIDIHSNRSEHTEVRDEVDDLADVTADLNFETSQDVSTHSEYTSNYNESMNQPNDIDVFDPEYIEQTEIFSTGNPYSSSNRSASSIKKTQTSESKGSIPSNNNISNSTFPHSSGTTDLGQYSNIEQQQQQYPNKFGNNQQFPNQNNNFTQDNRQGPNNQPRNIYQPNNNVNNVYQQQRGNQQNQNGVNQFGQPQHIRAGPLQTHHNPNNMQAGSPVTPSFGNPYQGNPAQRMQYPAKPMNGQFQSPHKNQMYMNNGVPQQRFNNGMPQQRMNMPNPMYKNPQYSNSGNSIHSNHSNKGPAPRTGGGFSQFMPSTTAKNPYAS
ncbi:hypothetical protein C6P45_000641 [Maudiozyma exigua]|uniref:PH domain-containing protein n=1 Tax=Maudiozyma exigua TaxID=34358 RepID=A0A9P6W574_MAUEX|nr:hypothetical protein C6P45_000641 [Kazachstania exigua]